MAWTIVPEHGRLHIRAILTSGAEIEEVINALRRYSALGECNDRSAVHAGAAPVHGTDDAAARTAGDLSEAEAQGGKIAAAGGAVREEVAPEKVAGGPIKASETSQAPEGTSQSYTSERSVPRYD